MSEAADVVITTVLFILVIVDIVGNSVVCAIIKRSRDMRYANKPDICKYTKSIQKSKNVIE